MPTPPTPPTPPTSPTAIDAVVAELDAAERGVVLGLLAAGQAGSADRAADGPDGPYDTSATTDTDATVALTAPARQRCAQATRAIAALPRSERVHLMGLLAREALAPIPAGIEDVDSDTLREALDGESDETVALVTGNGPPRLREAGRLTLAARGHVDWPAVTAPADVIADLQRAVLASIVAVPALPPGLQPTRWARRLLALTPAALLTELTAAGADLLGASLRGADEETLRRATAHVGATWSDRIAAVARSTSAATTSATTGAPGLTREQARTLVATVTPATDPGQTLQRLGARALGARLGREDPGLSVAVAQRLPGELSRQVRAASVSN